MATEESKKEFPILFPCNFPGCNKTFKKKSKLERHVLAHSDIRSFTCSVCSTSFKRKDHLKRHMSSHEVNRKKFHCPYIDCTSIGFVDNYHLRRHMDQIHNLPIMCNICSFRFDKKWLLTKHKHLIHNEPAPYQCDKCNSPYYTLVRYQAHLAKNCIENNNSIQLPHKRSKPEGNDGSKHNERKNVYKCPYKECNKFLTTPYNLKVHIQKHHERNITEKCNVEGCDACYLYKKSLKEHLEKVHNIKEIIAS